MKVTGIETLHADAGWRIFAFLKITTDAGITGWSEYSGTSAEVGLSKVIEALAHHVIGEDPRRVGRIIATLHVHTCTTRGGLIAQAIGAIENALLDIAGKDLGVPVYQLFGGPVRQRIPVYWSHAATYRVRNAALLGVPELRTYDDLASCAEEIRRRGFKALKGNIMASVDGRLISYAPGFGRTPGWPELNWDKSALRAAADTVAALRNGAGPDMGLMLDVNFHFKTEGFCRIADAIAPYDMTWLELDTYDPASLALIRRHAPFPIASCEALCGRSDFRPFFEMYATDVAIVDVVWNGLGESLKIAAMAEPYEINMAPHNYYGHLASAISATFCAVVPNFRMMETDIDSAPWRDELVTAVPQIDNGEMVLSDKPGWGIDINEDAVCAHPPRH